MEAFKFDVVVVGGGTAGAAACIAAGRMGAKTLVVESLGSLGGTQSNGWVTPMMPNYLGPFKLDRGINLEIISQQVAIQPAADGELHGDVWYDPTALALVLDRMSNASGVTPLFNAMLCDTFVTDGKVKSIEVATRSGRLLIEADCFIDSTGDAELSFLAGAQLMGGDEDGTHQPMTLRFKMGNVDIETMRAGADFWRVNAPEHIETGFGEAKESPIGPWVHDAIGRGILHEDDLGYFQMFTMNGCPGEIAFNAPRISDLDPLDPFALSRAYQVGREKIYRICRFMQTFFPGFAQAFVSGIAPLIGIRESRRVVGEYILTADDHQACRKFPNAVARNRYPVDIHLNKAGGLNMKYLPKNDYHEIPYESIVVKGLSNLFVAGRCLSADFVAQSAVRIQPVCRSLGQAAGVAAALCSEAKIAAQDLDYAKLAPFLDLSLPDPSEFPTEAVSR
jgi:hypothetical protein